jgi:hypothetical protein
MVTDSDSEEWRRGVPESVGLKTEVRWMYVRVRVHMPWYERNARERRMGEEVE